MYYMKRNYNIILFAFFYLVCIGYTCGKVVSNTPKKDSSSEIRRIDYFQEIILKSTYLFDSRGIANKSIYDYFMGKYFTKEDINLLNRNLKSTSILGQDFITDLVFKRRKYFLNDLHYGFRSHFDGSIGKDLAGLASRGNAPYAGKNLDNTNLLFRSISWHKIGVSFCYFNKKQLDPVLTTSLNYVSGNNYTHINLNNTQIFTQQNGDYIDAKWNADYRSSTTNKVSRFGGNGASIDLKFQKDIYTKKSEKHYRVEAQVTDLGFISWNKNNKNLSWDSSLRFSGLDVGNITAITSKNYTDNLSDSLKTILNSHYNYLKNNSILPAIFVVKISKMYHTGKFSNTAYAKLDYMMQASYVPQLTLGMEALKGKHAFVPQIRFGGYGDFNVDLFYNYYISRGKTFQKWYFSVKLYSIEAIIAPKYQSGLGLGIQTNYKF